MSLLMSEKSSPSILAKYSKNIDHLAIAVTDLESSIEFHQNILGFTLVERRETTGKKTAMSSAVMRSGSITFVLIQGKSSDSQVSKFIEHYGPGVQHIAIEVENLINVSEELKKRGFEFDTDIIRSPGLKQIFSKRNPVSGLMIEFIEKTDNADFTDNSVQQLFESLEEKGSF